MERKYYKISTYGCQMNENDSEKIAGMLRELGYSPTNEDNVADIVILNTCSVRENADDKVFGHLGLYKHIKKQKPDMILCICGCMMQQESVVNQIRSKFKQVDLIFGTHNLHIFPELLSNYLEKREMVVDVWDEGQLIIEDLPTYRKYSFKAYVSIMYGCNNFCSYCIVPYTRGRERSRNFDSIIKEVESLASTGCKEITLLGQNVNSYGKTLDMPISFSDLLKMLCKVEGIERIRFMTSHPKDLSDELIVTISEEEKVCNHIHLPFQSGNTRILKEMNRKYTKEDYILLVDKIRKIIPNIALSTDIIVGFPGETEEEFLDTIDVVKKCGFDSSYTFLYSIRSGTPAEKMQEQIAEDIKHKRLNKLLDVQKEISKKINLEYKEKIVKVLVEGPSKNNPEILSGRTETNKLVNFAGNKDTIGSIVKVKITQAKTFSLDGVQV
ncbi:tRNA (N6-isopentenyl adenosine(37)-C2)-methylthiotransferase MiaB [Alkalibaculum sp. M08DMB]|uniref:tRNA-2-methylthio-N(6)-dimethylallyladenosine synthase n=1 Tax=Alkalibaculum sporogenes TaxID=2655001 RepID=A0A6A7K7Y7_9FIRM|nr:tRNA (N6-isopentenyl adenosine(37)-C2)-methylthiotransferase MiaB [Alkalibaculum sporogenes]MPW25213.1 tRNA (N6-isopentenyl adenosine(37)-C2)-methylthiotransferase MiaB [Alkalibaculum sporogenes]